MRDDDIMPKRELAMFEAAKARDKRLRAMLPDLNVDFLDDDELVRAELILSEIGANLDDMTRLVDSVRRH